MEGSSEQLGPAPARGRGWRVTGWTSAGCLLPLTLLGWWLALSLGLHSPRAPLDEEVEVAATPDAEAPETGATLAISGQGELALDALELDDRQGHRVLSVDTLRGRVDLSALQEGALKIEEAVVHGAEITLRRGPGGRVSLVEIMHPPESPEPAADADADEEEGEEAHDENPQAPGDGAEESAAREEAEPEAPPPPPPPPLRVEGGPFIVRDAIVNLEMGARPVRIAIHRAKLALSTRQEGGRRIRVWDVTGRILEPDVLPLPIRIVEAEGVIRIGYGELVDLTARVCVGRGEIRTRVVMPARRHPLEMTVDSRGMLGAMGRMGIFIAAGHAPDRLVATTGEIEMEAGDHCTRVDARLEDEEAEADGGGESRHERRLERRAERHDEREAEEAAEEAEEAAEEATEEAAEEAQEPSP